MSQVWINATGPTFWSGPVVWSQFDNAAWTGGNATFNGAVLEVTYDEGADTGIKTVGVKLTPTSALISALGGSPIYAIRLTGSDDWPWSSTPPTASLINPVDGNEDDSFLSGGLEGDTITFTRMEDPASIVERDLFITRYSFQEIAQYFPTTITNIELLIDEDADTPDFWTNRNLTRELPL